jgi:hypothetical protein
MTQKQINKIEELVNDLYDFEYQRMSQSGRIVLEELIQIIDMQ